MSSSLPARANLDLLETNYSAWKADAASVDAHWRAFFEGFELGLERLAKTGPAAKTADAKGGAALSESSLTFRMKVTEALMRFRALGHTGAWLDPLDNEAPEATILTLEALGFQESELNEPVVTQFFRKGQPITLGEMLTELRTIYCDRIGFEFMHIHKPDVR
ncbi:MAG: sucA, partial [Verrucomicrobiaceae bacterium]|nr:sucA [Verrucomicrobiaceae bacterium]